MPFIYKHLGKGAPVAYDENLKFGKALFCDARGEKALLLMS
jgi:hypothetical protein